MSKNNNHLGLILLLVGGIMLFNYFNFIHFSVWDLWPLILLYFGVKAERDYFAGYKTSKSLMVGAVLITYSVYFLIDGFTSYYFSELFQPLFILGPALGFFQMAYYGHRPKKNYRNGIILSVIAGAIFFDKLIDLKFSIVVAVGLIVIGLFLMFRDRVLPEECDEDDTHERYE